jgi:drug/metabolite transporter (DMT)-like permease
MTPTVRQGFLLLVLGSVLISFSAVFVKIAHVGPTVAGVYRNVFGALALFVLAGLRRDTLWRGWPPARYALLAAAFFAGDLFFWHRSIHFIGPGLATILGNSQVFLMALVGIFVFGERATWQFVLSLPLVVVGLLMLVGADWQSLGATYRLGVVFGGLTAVTYAGFLLTVRRAQRAPIRLSAGANLAIVTTFTALLMTIMARVEGKSLRIPDAQTFFVLVAYGVLCQGVGWALISRALRVVDASRVGLVLLLQPTLTFVWDILFFQRPTSLVEGLGALLALGAIYLGSVRRQ